MHTPAPWTAEATRNGKTFEVYFGDAEAGEAGAGWCTLSGANQADNARLIASAPDLVAALQQIADGCERRLRKGHDEGDAASLDIARSAIAKATGA